MDNESDLDEERSEVCVSEGVVESVNEADKDPVVERVSDVEGSSVSVTVSEGVTEAVSVIDVLREPEGVLLLEDDFSLLAVGDKLIVADGSHVPETLSVWLGVRDLEWVGRRDCVGPDVFDLEVSVVIDSVMLVVTLGVTLALSSAVAVIVAETE